ncbi:MAG TPA: hypothetical protein VKB93_08585 [Thermoanaerobaculia bacterium]|nr:hypothetical protein [Thermoanaerobaculia bacterium]
MNQDDKVVFEVKASETNLIFKRKSGTVRADAPHSISMTWEKHYDVRTVLGLNARGFLGLAYGVDPTKITLVDEAGREL